MAGNPFQPPQKSSGGPNSGGGPDAKQGAIARRISALSGSKGKGSSGPGQPSVNKKSTPPMNPNLTVNPGMYGG